MATDAGTEDKLDWLLRQLRLKRQRTPVVVTQDVGGDVRGDGGGGVRGDVGGDVREDVGGDGGGKAPDPGPSNDFEVARQEFETLVKDLDTDGIPLGGDLTMPYARAKGVFDDPTPDGQKAEQRVADFKKVVLQVRQETQLWDNAKLELAKVKQDVKELETRGDPEAAGLAKRLATAEENGTKAMFKEAADELAAVKNAATDLLSAYPKRAAWSKLGQKLQDVETAVARLTKIHPPSAQGWADRLKDARDKAGRHDYDKAVSDLSTTHDELNSNDDNPYAKAYEARFKEHKDETDRRVQWFNSPKAGNPVPDGVSAEHQKLTQALDRTEQAMKQARKDGDYGPVDPLLSAMVNALSQFDSARKGPVLTFEYRLNKMSDRGAKVRDSFATKKLYGDPPAKPLTDALNDFTNHESVARNTINSAKKDHDITAAQAAMLPVEPALKTLEQEAGRQVVRALKGGKLTRNSTVRKGIMDQHAQDPQTLKFMAQCDEGVKLLDDLVKGVGAKAKGDDQEFVKQAIIAKYGLTKLEGQLGKKALPRLYKVLGMVPLTHTRDNIFLEEIKRDKAAGQKVGGDPSSYNEKKVLLNLDGVDVGTAKFDCDPDVPKKHRAKKAEVNYFNHTTLHELGHALDDKLKFMAGKAGNASFGGWQKEEGPEALADAIGNDTSRGGGFYARFSAKIPKAGLKACLTEVLGDGKVSDKVLTLVSKATPPLSEQERKDLEGHPALAWCQDVRMQGTSNGLWDDGARSKANAIGDRVYQQSYSSEWTSYSVTSRKKGVSSYQFRSPAEWFAELYAAYHMKVLPDAHPDYDWVSKLDPKT